MLRAACLLVAAALLACGDDTAPPPPAGSGGGGSSAACAVSERLSESGECCAPGTRPMPEGCVPAGIPAASCGEGFVSDEAGGCHAILPDAPCADGWVALPGETACRPLVDCGQAPWGDIPVEPNSEYVDASHSGTSDGSAAAPWTSIQAGIDAAEEGAIVAVAAGQYLEDLDIHRSVRVLGRCPEMVQIVGQGAVGAVEITTEAAGGAVVGRLAITGPAIGIVVFGPNDVLLDRLWVHDTAQRAVDFEDNFGETGGTMQGSLVERAADASVILLGASLTLRDSVLRDAQPGGSQGLARGLVVKHNSSFAVRSHAIVEHSLIERTRDSGVIVEYSDLDMTDTLVRDIEPNAASQRFGRGLELQDNSSTGEPAVGFVRGSVIERAHDAGIFIDGSTLTLETSVVRDVEPEVASDLFGTGILLQQGELQGRGQLTVTASVVERTRTTAINALASDVTLDGVLVRDTQPGNAENDVTGYGIGFGIQDELSNGQRAYATVRSSAFERNLGLGIRSQGSDMQLEGVAIRDTLPLRVDGKLGHGLEILDSVGNGQPSHVTAIACAVERNHDAGILVHESVGSISNTVVRDTLPKQATGEHGMGIVGQRLDPAAAVTEVTLADVRVENSTGIGVLMVGARLGAERVHVLGVAPQVADGLFGDGIAIMGATGIVRDSRIEGAARVGVASFAASFTLSGSRLECNAIHMSGQAVAGVDFSFTDDGGNSCGCGEADEGCKIVGSDLEVPTPVE